MWPQGTDHTHEGVGNGHFEQRLPGQDQTCRQECLWNDAIYCSLGFGTKPQKQKPQSSAAPKDCFPTMTAGPGLAPSPTGHHSSAMKQGWGSGQTPVGLRLQPRQSPQVAETTGGMNSFQKL